MKSKLILLLIPVMMSCTAAWHQKMSKKHELLAIAKGAKIETDTVFKTIALTKEIPGTDTTTKVVTVIDTIAFAGVMDKNDSLVVAIYNLRQNISSGMALDREKSMYALKKANEELRVLRSRVSRGFSKDSAYIVEPDSLTKITVVVQDGTVQDVIYERKPQKLTFEEKVPVEVKRILSYGYTYWQVIGAGLILLIVGLIIGYFLKSR